MCRQAGAEKEGIEITPKMVGAGVKFLRGYYSCAWGSESEPISESEATAVVRGVLSASGLFIRGGFDFVNEPAN